ncbi:MAG: cytochrome c biogenesis protein CcsA [Magnetococcales bacterium]|nr:cytochrome c biogenesis protein CcsA [Magnetococcales bacterium]NGZ28570.1 cytochrome c biogenesis protein CcsA [Magnetococcales bacterium]
MLESQLLWLAVGCYLVATGLAFSFLVVGQRFYGLILTCLAVGVVLHAAAIGLRWQRLGHGPFVTLFEILTSNLWSLLLAYTLAIWRVASVRLTAAVVLPVMTVMMVWLLSTDPKDSQLPATYTTSWLYIHVTFGKIFMGLLLVAAGIGGVVNLRRWGLFQARLASLPSDVALDELAFRFLSLGLVFDSFMLIAGAIWAQDAWGRYWDWDSLEAWSLVNWLSLALVLHLRVAWRPPPWLNGLLAIFLFCLAYVVFFGVPFISQAPHRGVV